MPQIKAKVENKNTTWNARMRFRVGANVKHNDVSYVNVTGGNGEPGVSGDWVRSAGETVGVTEGYVDQKALDAENNAKAYAESLAIGGGGSGLTGRYLTVAAMIADQNTQLDLDIFRVTDASEDPTVTSGRAYYEYLGTTNGTLDDYYKMSEEESMDLDLDYEARIAALETESVDHENRISTLESSGPEGTGAVISTIDSVLVNYVLSPADKDSIKRVKDYATIVIPTGLGLKFRTIIKKKTLKTVSVTPSENVVIETPADFLNEILSENDYVELILEEITGGIEYWGIAGALNEKAGGELAPEGLKTALTISQVTKNSLYFPTVFKASDYPMFTFSKDYFVLYSTVHDGSVGGLYWGEMDDPEYNGFVEKGLITSGDQSETPWLIKIPSEESGISEEIFLFYHKKTTSGQETHLITTNGGGLLHESVWTDRGKPLGLLADENHTGYARVYRRGVNDYIALHLTKSAPDSEAKISTSPDGLNWTRLLTIDRTTAMPAGSNFHPFTLPFTYNSKQYVFLDYFNPDGKRFIAVAEADGNFMPTLFIKTIYEFPNLNNVMAYIKNDVAYVVLSTAFEAPTEPYYLLIYPLNNLL